MYIAQAQSFIIGFVLRIRILKMLVWKSRESESDFGLAFQDDEHRQARHGFSDFVSPKTITRILHSA